jgi:phosphoribosyl-AMP cyclohydrolase
MHFTSILSIFMEKVVSIAISLQAQLSDDGILYQTRIMHSGYLQTVKGVWIPCDMDTLLYVLIKQQNKWVNK